MKIENSIVQYKSEKKKKKSSEPVNVTFFYIRFNKSSEIVELFLTLCSNVRHLSLIYMYMAGIKNDYSLKCFFSYLFYQNTLQSRYLYFYCNSFDFLSPTCLLFLVVDVKNIKRIKTFLIYSRASPSVLYKSFASLLM